ncbi:MAG: glutamyl-tRNA reductase [Gammaproteobacteria bacterium]|jgi:glutamyl-tRNA reductase|nr:glutamyl-tRNA reductase [Gammaproteobacteria bacterium]MBT5203095.1 glutamyl-tRNA reductase [Gammaproteobacteria bacterium]MBT5602737.1 glutamyl-tRNA reductase [Gammaproteobacteria bacterium]MBT6247080.1 glutamyl-tRNA reductase [Gammaproteobacteria bacterium]
MLNQLMNLTLLGINHQSAPIALREKVAFGPEHIGVALTNLKTELNLDEVAILSTCNRTEVIASGASIEPGEIRDWLAKYHGLETQVLIGSDYHFLNEEAVHHLMRVASGLDSMVLGEPQILGQVKAAFAESETASTLGGHLQQIAQATFRTAKKVRTETSIGRHVISAPSTAVNLAKRLFTDISRCNALLIGVNEMIELSAKHLIEAGVKNITIANRTLDHAKPLADQISAQIIELDMLPEQIVDTDIIITATASSQPLITRDTIDDALMRRKHKPIFMVDLAVPRDIDATVATLRDAYLYSLDDLQIMINENLAHRLAAAEQAESVVQASLNQFLTGQRSRNVVDTLVSFRQQIDLLKNSELEKATSRLQAGDPADKVLTRFANQFTQKLTHGPSIEIKKAAAEGELELVAAITKLFNLPGGDES